MKTILFQGDSITDCGRIRIERDENPSKLIYKMKKRTPLGSGYPSLVADKLSQGREEYTFLNRGISGDRILDVYARIVRDIINIKPDYMSLLIGVNDIWHGLDWGNGTGIKRFEKVYDILLGEISEELPHTKIMLLEPFILEGTATLKDKPHPERFDIFKKGIEETSEITRSLAKKYNVKFVELQKVFDNASKTVPCNKLLSDGVHPTLQGHTLITEEWLKAFSEIK